MHLPTQVWLLLLLLPLGYLLLFWRTLPLRKWHLVLVFFILGALRLQYELPDALDKHLAQFNEQGRASLVGVVAADPDVRQTQALIRVDVSKIQTKFVKIEHETLKDKLVQCAIDDYAKPK